MRTAATGSAAFRRAYAAAVIDAVSTAYKKAGIEAAARLITLVDTLDTTDAVPLLLEALKDPRVGVRAAAAIGLYRLRPELAAAGGEPLGRVLTALVDAGKQAKSATVLEIIYKALDYGALENPPSDPRIRQALLSLLTARAQELNSENMPAAGADVAGLRAARHLAGQLSDDERKTLLNATGAFMRYAMERYTTGPRKLADVRDREGSRQAVALRDRIEQTLIVGEELLADLLNVPRGERPDIYGAMRNLETVKMKNEWQRWNERLKAATGNDYALRESAEGSSKDSTAPESSASGE